MRGSAYYSLNSALALQQKGWTSSMYDHFHAPTIFTINGVVKYRFVCKTSVSLTILSFFIEADTFYIRNPSQSCTRARTDSGTTNLIHHTDTCSGKKAPDDQTITKFTQGSTYSTSAFCFLITHWVTECHWPFKITEDPPLQEMLKMLYRKVEIPSDMTVSHDVMEVHGISKGHVAKRLQVSHLYTLLIYRYLQSYHIRHMLGASMLVLMDGHHQTLSHSSE